VGARLVALELRRTNLAARSLYERLGFAVIGERKGYYSDTGEDAVEMRLDLR
jgi:ribosomal-protein-alanine N-acetyltransferase